MQSNKPQHTVIHTLPDGTLRIFKQNKLVYHERDMIYQLTNTNKPPILYNTGRIVSSNTPKISLNGESYRCVTEQYQGHRSMHHIPCMCFMSRDFNIVKLHYNPITMEWKSTYIYKANGKYIYPAPGISIDRQSAYVLATMQKPDISNRMLYTRLSAKIMRDDSNKIIAGFFPVRKSKLIGIKPYKNKNVYEREINYMTNSDTVDIVVEVNNDDSASVTDLNIDDATSLVSSAISTSTSTSKTTIGIPTLDTNCSIIPPNETTLSYLHLSIGLTEEWKRVYKLLLPTPDGYFVETAIAERIWYSNMGRLKRGDINNTAEWAQFGLVITTRYFRTNFGNIDASIFTLSTFYREAVLRIRQSTSASNVVLLKEADETVNMLPSYCSINSVVRTELNKSININTSGINALSPNAKNLLIRTPISKWSTNVFKFIPVEAINIFKGIATSTPEDLTYITNIVKKISCLFDDDSFLWYTANVLAIYYIKLHCYNTLYPDQKLQSII